MASLKERLIQKRDEMLRAKVQHQQTSESKRLQIQEAEERVNEAWRKEFERRSEVLISLVNENLGPIIDILNEQFFGGSAELKIVVSKLTPFVAYGEIPKIPVPLNREMNVTIEISGNTVVHSWIDDGYDHEVARSIVFSFSIDEGGDIALTIRDNDYQGSSVLRHSKSGNGINKNLLYKSGKFESLDLKPNLRKLNIKNKGWRQVLEDIIVTVSAEMM